jgi:hypothetical protein
MGHFSYSCKLTGLPITGGTPVALFPMLMRANLYDNSEEQLRKYGKSSLISNDGPRLRFIPCAFPIFGKYDEYGGIEDIVEDDNTRVLEEHFGLPIAHIVSIMTSHRKDDGYDDCLTDIKNPLVYPDNWKKGEDHIKRYCRLTKDKQPKWPKGDEKSKEYKDEMKLYHEHHARYREWCKIDLDLDNDRNPTYQEKYQPLINMSCMWVHGDVYRQLTDDKRGGYGDKLDVGNASLLKSLGFEEIENGKDKRYNRQFQKDGKVIKSDGTWVNFPNEGVYSLTDLKKACAKIGIEIDITEANKKGKIEQIYDYIIQDYEYLVKPTTDSQDYKKLIEEYKALPPEKLQEMMNIFEVDTPEILAMSIAMFRNDSIGSDRMGGLLKYYFLSTDGYESRKASNPLMEKYFQSAKQGGLKDNLVRFWIFDGYMFDMGRYYDLIGTSPQDGEHKNVLKVLEIAVNILKPVVDEYEAYNDEEEENEE